MCDMLRIDELQPPHDSCSEKPAFPAGSDSCVAKTLRTNGKMLAKGDYIWQKK